MGHDRKNGSRALRTSSISGHLAFNIQRSCQPPTWSSPSGSTTARPAIGSLVALRIGWQDRVWLAVLRSAEPAHAALVEIAAGFCCHVAQHTKEIALAYSCTLPCIDKEQGCYLLPDLRPNIECSLICVQRRIALSWNGHFSYIGMRDCIAGTDVA